MNYRRVRFEGYSMYPALRPGDTLILGVIPGADCAPGDIVCVPGMQGLIVHRVIRMDRSVIPPTIVTKGDNLTYPDPPAALPPGGIPRVIMISRRAQGPVRPRFRRLMVALSRRNLTIGILKGRLGKVARWMYGRFLALFSREISKP
jgi:signal peptidase I